MDKGSGSGIFPDPDPGDQKRPDPTGSGSRSATLLWSTNFLGPLLRPLLSSHQCSVGTPKKASVFGSPPGKSDKSTADLVPSTQLKRYLNDYFKSL